MNETPLRSVALLISASLAIAILVYAFNFWLFASNSYLSERLTPKEASLMEGVISMLLGLLLVIGSGGITLTTRRAAALAAAAGSVSSDTVGPSEVYRRDAWKPQGFVRAGLLLLIAGAMLIVIYFLVP
jgi:hypothetical protein